MTSCVIYLEGGGDGKDLHVRCREAFRRLLEHMGFQGRMPRLVACGGRGQAFKDFCTALRRQRYTGWTAMWLDSEEPMVNLEDTWVHLAASDGWQQPTGAANDDVLLMVTCMETWIVADRDALKQFYGARLRETALPPLDDLECRPRTEIQASLENATRGARNSYRKGRRAFELLCTLNPDNVECHCESLKRCRRVLEEHL